MGRRRIIGVASAAVALALAGGLGYLGYRHFASSAPGQRTFLGSASNVSLLTGDGSAMSVYACVEKKSNTSWTVRLTGELQPVASDATNYSLTAVVWPFRSVTAAPNGVETPRGQASTSSWSGNRSASVALRVVPGEENYLQATVARKGSGSKLLPPPSNDLSNVTDLARC